MLLADLKAMAGGLGISGAARMKKADLVAAIKAAQSGGKPSGAPKVEAQQDRAKQGEVDRAPAKAGEPKANEGQAREGQTRDDQAPAAGQGDEGRNRTRNRNRDQKQDQQQSNQGQNEKQQSSQGDKQQNDKQAQGDKQQQNEKGRSGQGKQQRNQNDNQAQGDKQAQNDKQQHDGGDDEGSGRSRRRRGRDRTGRGNRNEPDTTILDDDVLVPAAGILDVLDNYAFVRTSGYLAGPDDVYVSLSMVRKHGLRRGDAVVGQVRQPREGERREKFNPMVRIDAVNGADPEAMAERADFDKLTAVHPSERLRMETTASDVTGRLIDLAAPLGKGQRALVVSPARAGKTTLLRSVAHSISTNNPECHLMVVLVDERPEEVTDFQRSIKGEVIASTLDRPALDHTTLAELAIERAKRLVELGHDVVVLLDGITRLGRAYTMANPASGRVLSGGVDAASLHPPKKFFGAARNVENGGSLTILATALVDSGSQMDEAILEEIQAAGNAEIRLLGDHTEPRSLPAIDLASSGTHREDLLLGDQEIGLIRTLRSHVAGLGGREGLDFLRERLSGSQSNVEFLMQWQRDGASR
ncbi:transcription termination factor Rho [Nocardioides sp. AE5]|nr:transcription termination factor Rho [Nocardioides sp. AE5]